MDSSNPIPRVNGEILHQFVSRKVRLVGKVDRMANGEVYMKTSDGHDVVVQTSGPSPRASFVEFEGTVTGARSMQEESHSDWGEDFGTLEINMWLLAFSADTPLLGSRILSWVAPGH